MRIDLHHHYHHHHHHEPAIEQRLVHILSTLETLGSTIMSKISDFAAAVQTSFDAANAALGGIQEDVTSLKAQIDALQNSPGTLSPEDQALLNDIQGNASALATKVGDIDALTPPPPPAA